MSFNRVTGHFYVACRCVAFKQVDGIGLGLVNRHLFTVDVDTHQQASRVKVDFCALVVACGSIDASGGVTIDGKAVDVKLTAPYSFKGLAIASGAETQCVAVYFCKVEASDRVT